MGATTRSDSRSVFESSHPFLFFDYFRVPYQLAPDPMWPAGPTVTRPDEPLGWCGQLGWAGTPRRLLWPVLDAGGTAEPAATAGVATPRAAELEVDDIPFYARVVPDAMTAASLEHDDRAWRRWMPVRDRGGDIVASLWRDGRGDVFLPFDPSEAISNFWSERYEELQTSGPVAGAKKLAMWSYYRLRPALPRSAQIWMRRRFSRIQARTRFPRWPVEPALHDLYALLFRLVADVAGQPVPWISPWPAGYSWALVLTHDVETSVGYANLRTLQSLETELGYRSSWNFVPKRYDVEDGLVDSLRRDGFEVGVHGLYHDGRDLESLAVLEQRLPAVREHADRWQAVGFRSPATHRVWEWMPLLGFDYDSSSPDTDPFEPQSGGCCSWLPFLNQNLVELPITLPQDHTLFVVLGHRNEELWVEKTEFLKKVGGMALLITHPDYLLDEDLVGLYRRFLQTYKDDGTAWRALPSEVSDWWRRRAASSLVPSADGWRVVGPAAGEASVELAGPL